MSNDPEEREEDDPGEAHWLGARKVPLKPATRSGVMGIVAVDRGEEDVGVDRDHTR